MGNTGLMQINGTTASYSINFNNFEFLYNPTSNITQNAVELGAGTSDNFSQCVFSGNTIFANFSYSIYTSAINFIKSYRNITYSQIYNNSFYGLNYIQFGAWLDAGTNLTTGTIIANNTNN